MSRVSVTLCDGCGKEITGKPMEPDLALVVCMPKTKMTAHYCYMCSSSLFNAMNELAEERKKAGEQE